MLEAATSRVGNELERLQETVHAASAKAHGERLHIATEARKRRRRSGDAAAAQGAESNNPDAAAEAAFQDNVVDVDERLQAARRAMVRAHAATQGARGRRRGEIDGARARVARPAGGREGGAERGLQRAGAADGPCGRRGLEPRRSPGLPVRGEPVAAEGRLPRVLSVVNNAAVDAAARCVCRRAGGGQQRRAAGGTGHGERGGA